MSLNTILEVVTDDELRNIDFCAKLMRRALREGDKPALTLFLEKISNLFIFDDDFRNNILETMSYIMEPLSFKSLNSFGSNSIPGNVAALHHFLLKNPVINIDSLKTLAKSHVIEKISETSAEHLIPTKTKVTLNIETETPFLSNTENIDSLVQTAEFLLNNRLLKKNESSIYGMKALYQNANSPLLKVRSKILVARHPEDLSFAEYHARITELSDLINRLAEEPEFQSFFEKNPFFLNPYALKAIAKKSLGGELFPDFVIELYNQSTLIIEIEKPATKLYTKKGNPTGKLGQAEQQVRDYLSWALKENQFLRGHGIENISPEKTTGILIIGSKLNPSEIQKLHERNHTTANFKIKTFSDVLSENEVILANLQTMKTKN